MSTVEFQLVGAQQDEIVCLLKSEFWRAPVLTSGIQCQSDLVGVDTVALLSAACRGRHLLLSWRSPTTTGKWFLLHLVCRWTGESSACRGGAGLHSPASKPCARSRRLCGSLCL